MSTRKVFNYDDFTESKIVPANKLGTYHNTISACGCLFKNNDRLLLIKYEDPKWPNLDDFGGQVDNDDESPFDTIIRETFEETNGAISKKIVKNFLDKKKYTAFYTGKSKYFCTVFEVDDDFIEDTSVFGTVETADNIKRTIDWYTISEAKNKLSNRLKFNADIMKFLEKINYISNSFTTLK